MGDFTPIPGVAPSKPKRFQPPPAWSAPITSNDVKDHATLFLLTFVFVYASFDLASALVAHLPAQTYYGAQEGSFFRATIDVAAIVVLFTAWERLAVKVILRWFPETPIVIRESAAQDNKEVTPSG